MKDLVKTDNDMDLVKALEKIFSLHDVDMIYNVLQEFRGIDTKQGEITFDDFIKQVKASLVYGRGLTRVNDMSVESQCIPQIKQVSER